MNADMLLKHAAGVIANRRDIYGEPSDAMNAVAKRWSLTLGVRVSAAQVVLCLIDLKLARLAHSRRHLDSWVDAAAYAAIGAELAAEEA